MYHVIGAPFTRAFRVIWALEELGLPYSLDPASPHDEVVFAHNPSGKVPVLVTEDGAITDSVAIVQFLADRHGGLTHAAGSMERARQDAMTLFLLDEIEGPLWTAAKHGFLLPEDERVPAAKATARAEFARSLAILETRLGGQAFAAGETLSVPDLVFGYCALWAAKARFPIPRGPVRDYATRLHARPAFQRVMALQAG